MARTRIRETTQRWCARHAFLAGLAAGTIVTLVFVILVATTR